MSVPALFEDLFEVQERDPDGKYFDRGACSALVPAGRMPLLAHTRCSLLQLTLRPGPGRLRPARSACLWTLS